MNQIARGEADAGGFLQGIIRMLKELISRYSGVSEKQKEQFSHGTKKEVWEVVPDAESQSMRDRKTFTVQTENVSLLFGKMTASLRARAKRWMPGQ